MTSKKKNKDVETHPEVVGVQEAPKVAVPTSKTSAVRAKAKKQKTMDFDRYARRKGIKAHHVAGMKAFAKNPNMPRTLAEWDDFFSSY